MEIENVEALLANLHDTHKKFKISIKSWISPDKKSLSLIETLGYNQILITILI